MRYRHVVVVFVVSQSTKRFVEAERGILGDLDLSFFLSFFGSTPPFGYIYRGMHTER